MKTSSFLPQPLLALALVSIWAPEVVTGFRFPDCVKGPLANNTVCNVTAPPPDRATALVKAMDITEKLTNLVEYVTLPGSLGTRFWKHVLADIRGWETV